LLRDFLTGIIARFQQPQHSVPVAERPEVPSLPASGSATLTYNLFCDMLSAWLAAEWLVDSSVLVLGESTALYVFSNLFDLAANSFVAQAAWGSLGHETGSALGVALGSGKRPFVVAGDGSFMMICQEISSLAMQKSNAVVFVLSNRVYAIEQAFVDLDAFTDKVRFANYNLLPTWDYLALAQAFGARGFSARTLCELRAVLADLKTIEDQPVLVEIVIPQDDLAPQLKRLAQPQTR
jgi:indolepyruvate decarboxylase